MKYELLKPKCIGYVFHLYCVIIAQNMSETRRTMPEDSVLVIYWRISIMLLLHLYFLLSNLQISKVITYYKSTEWKRNFHFIF